MRSMARLGSSLSVWPSSTLELLWHCGAALAASLHWQFLELHAMGHCSRCWISYLGSSLALRRISRLGCSLAVLDFSHLGHHWHAELRSLRLVIVDYRCSTMTIAALPVDYQFYLVGQLGCREEYGRLGLIPFYMSFLHLGASLAYAVKLVTDLRSRSLE